MHRGFVLAFAALFATSACSSEGHETRRVSITVSAASSLTDAFTRLGSEFERKHEGIKISFNFAGSAALVAQIENGAPVDVFASADEANMRKLTGERLVSGTAEIFVRNTLAIVVAKGNPQRIRALADLARPRVIVAVCAPAVPCGALAAKVIERSGAAIEPSTQEENVKAVATRVSTGEADAGLVYVTDARTSGLTAVSIPASQNALTRYPIAVLRDAKHRDAAKAFVAYVRSGTGQRTLRRFGFLRP